MNPQFLRELEDSLYLHRPLPLHREQSLEASFPAKRVLDRQHPPHHKHSCSTRP